MQPPNLHSNSRNGTISLLVSILVTLVGHAVLTVYPTGISCVYCDSNKGLALPVCTCVHAAVVTQLAKCLPTAFADLLALLA